MTKVLIVQELWWPKGGGGVLATHLITKILSKHGFKVKVVTGVKDYEMINDVEFIYEYRLKADNKLRLWLNIYALCKESWFRKLTEWADVVYIPRYAYPAIPMAKALKKKVIVHLHDYQPISYTAVIFYNDRFKSDFKRTFYYESHQHSLAKALIVSPLTPINRLARKNVSQADIVICISKKQREIIEEAMPEIRGKTTVVYNPLPNIPFIDKRLADEKILLYLGGSSFVKGFHIVLQAIDKAMKRYSDLKVIMTRVKGKEIFTQNCVVYEELPYEKVVKLHSKAYALLFPSICEEPLPYVVIESMLMGTIPIAAIVGGAPEIIEGSPAEKYLFTPENIDEFIDKIESLLSQSRDNIMNIGSSLREIVLKKFNSEITERKLIEVLSS
jgi:glycosyltransferase involved in cell wall biosynthesis